jgi:hypothetical protein
MTTICHGCSKKINEEEIILAMENPANAKNLEGSPMILSYHSDCLRKANEDNQKQPPNPAKII